MADHIPYKNGSRTIKLSKHSSILILTAERKEGGDLTRTSQETIYTLILTHSSNLGMRQGKPSSEGTHSKPLHALKLPGL